MPDYRTRSYWNAVGERLADRESADSALIAGDDSPFYRHKRTQFLDRLLRPVLDGLDPDAVLLEVGCGPGGNVRIIQARGQTVMGADVSAAMLGVAQQQGTRGLMLMDGSRLPVRDAAVTATFAATVLQHNPPEAAETLLAEMARVSRHEVHLFEDAGWFAVHDRASHWVRRPEWYVRRLRRHGFVLTHRECLRTAASELSAVAIRALTRRRAAEGSSITRRWSGLEAGTLGLTTWLDRWLPAPVALTRMSFARVGDGGSDPVERP